MIVWLLAFLALVAVGLAPPLDVRGRPVRSAPSGEPCDDAQRKPTGKATPVQRDRVASSSWSTVALFSPQRLPFFTRGEHRWSAATVRPTFSPARSATHEQAHMSGSRHPLPSRRPWEQLPPSCGSRPPAHLPAALIELRLDVERAPDRQWDRRRGALSSVPQPLPETTAR